MCKKTRRPTTEFWNISTLSDWAEVEAKFKRRVLQSFRLGREVPYYLGLKYEVLGR